MGFTIEQQQRDVQAAHRFQVSAELQDIQLLDCAASVSESNGQLEGQLRLGLKIETAVLSVSEGNARFRYGLAFLAIQPTPRSPRNGTASK